jgi:HlyD family secretion protein
MSGQPGSRAARAVPLAIVAVVLAGLGVAAALAVVSYLRWAEGKKSDRVLRVSGNIEVTAAQVGFKIAGRVEARLLDEGDPVRAGQPVAVLDSGDLAGQVALRQAELSVAEAALAELLAGARAEEIAAAEAAVKVAQARLAELHAGSRPQEIAVALAVVDQAKAELDRRKTEFDRMVRLKAENRATDIEYDRARTDYDAGRAMLAQAEARHKLIVEGPRQEDKDAAQAEVDQAKARRDLVVHGPRKEVIDQARARVEQAQVAVDLARTQLSYAEIVSPLTGVVLSKNVEPGECVAPGTPVITVADLHDCWLRAYVAETDLGRVKLGQRVRVTVDAWPGREFVGRVSFIASQAEFTPKTVQTDKERVKLVYRIKITLANPRMELKPGMPADAEILLDQFVAPTHPTTQRK